MATRISEFSVLSWNIAEYIRPGKAASRAPYVEQVLREKRPAIALLQEIYAPTRAEAVDRVASLAQKTGLECELPNGDVAVAFGSHEMHAAVLWDRDHGVVPVPDMWRFYGLGELWHALVVGTVTIEDVPFSVGGYQAPSLAKNKRANEVKDIADLLLAELAQEMARISARTTDEAERIMLAATSNYTTDALLLCGDFNSLSNARKSDGSYYDPDPYEGKKPNARTVSQVLWTETPKGDIIDIRADRRPAEHLAYGGLLHDVAASLGGEWQATIGRWYPDGPHGLRRVDLAWATLPVLRAVRRCEPIATTMTKKASDHDPLETVVDLNKVRENLAALKGTAE